MKLRRQIPKTSNPKLCNFKEVFLAVPRLKLLKLVFKRTFLQYDEIIFLKVLEARVELAMNRLAHIKSLVEKALLKKA